MTGSLRHIAAPPDIALMNPVKTNIVENLDPYEEIRMGKRHHRV